MVTIPGYSFHLSGRFDIPGDKSFSHRALILGALRKSPTYLKNLNDGEDVQKTLQALVALGCKWENDTLTAPLKFQQSPYLDMGNSGTSARLLMGLLCKQPFISHLTGDSSLSRRPMRRVIDLLRFLGGCIQGETLPLTILPCGKQYKRHITIDIPSAQVKSAVLIASLLTPGETVVEEAYLTRPHTEELLKQWDFPFTQKGRLMKIQGIYTGHMDSLEYTVPGDPSAAAFGLVAALICPHSAITVHNVALCPYRRRYLNVLESMGARFIYKGCSVTAVSSPLKGVHIASDLAPSLIDEYPILAMAAAHAEGVTWFRGVQELRYKESNRLQAIYEGLRQFGVDVDVIGDDLRIEGKTFKNTHAITIDPQLDHRIAMSFAIFGLSVMNELTILNTETIDTSFKKFPAWLAGLMHPLLKT